METNQKKYVAYYRVSTKKQGISGLGLASQKEIVCNYIAPEKIFAEFTEIESGKNNNRTELNRALDLCKKNDAVLIIAKLDRLSRNINFITSLMESKVNFECCDLPQANNFTIHIFAALAEQERKMISERTKRGLEQAKIKGKIIGSPENLTKEAIRRGLEVRIENSKENENNKRAFAVIENNYKKLTLQQISDKLNKAGFKTAKGGQFSSVQVKRIFEKYTTK